MLTNYPCWACVEIAFCDPCKPGLRRRLAQNERRASSAQIRKMTPAIRFPPSLSHENKNWSHAQELCIENPCFDAGNNKRYFKLESLYCGVELHCGICLVEYFKYGSRCLNCSRRVKTQLIN